MDNIRRLTKGGKGWWTGEEISSILALARPQAAVFCSRAARRGDLVQVRRGLYVLPGWLGQAAEADIFAISNLLQTPSYVSLSTALSFHGVSTQIPRSSCEAISPVRSRAFEADGFRFLFVHVPRALFFGFRREGRFFVAEPEKAFLDAAYLSSLGRYALDATALDRSRLDGKKIRRLLSAYPARTQKWTAKALEGP